jgi:hypothetical protein
MGNSSRLFGIRDSEFDVSPFDTLHTYWGDPFPTLRGGKKAPTLFLTRRNAPPNTLLLSALLLVTNHVSRKSG